MIRKGLDELEEGAVPEQPNHGEDQVRSVEELLEDKTYHIHTSNCPAYSATYKGQEGSLLIFEKDDGERIKISPRDYALKPYESGYWNPFNWIEKGWDAKMTEELHKRVMELSFR